MYLAPDLNTGAIQIDHSYVKAIDLNQFQLATLLTQMSQPRLVGGGPFRKWYTPQRCHEDFVGAAAASENPPLRVIWCAQAYREFEGLYDVALIAVTQDQGSEALVSRLRLLLQAVGYDDAVALGKNASFNRCSRANDLGRNTVASPRYCRAFPDRRSGGADRPRL